MVVTRAPLTADTGVMQERSAFPSTCTVQAPHWAMPQPNLVPVSLSSSRSTQSSGVLSSDCTETALPLRLNATIGWYLLVERESCADARAVSTMARTSRNAANEAAA